MSTPNDKDSAAFDWGRSVGEIQRINNDVKNDKPPGGLSAIERDSWQHGHSIGYNQPRISKATQPSPAAVEQALAEEKTNAEKIGATVQAARASATQPCHPFPPQGSFTNKEVHDTLKQKDSEIRSLQKQANDSLMLEMDMERRLNISESERDALQAQRDELLVACKGLMQAYAWNADKTAQEQGEQALQSDVQRARAAIARATEGGTGQ